MKADFSDATIEQCRAFLDEAVPGNQFGVQTSRWMNYRHQVIHSIYSQESEIEAWQSAARHVKHMLSPQRRAHCLSVARKMTPTP